MPKDGRTPTDPKNLEGARRNASGSNQKGGRGSEGERNKRTEGKDRDFDESAESKDQGHGHPREERSTS